MIYKDLYNNILIEPIKEGADQLDIISGYATASMAYIHLDEALNTNPSMRVNLIVGMPISDGMSLVNHEAFKKFMSEDFAGKFSCSYIDTAPPIHSKAYIWRKENKFIKSYIGSANYTQSAFKTDDKELMCEYNNSDILDYHHLLVSNSRYCNHAEIDSYITFYSDRQYMRTTKSVDQGSQICMDTGLQSVTVSFLTSQGDRVGAKSSLNWGQREGRNPNQAYMPLRPEVYNSDFFPPRNIQFTVRTDDNRTMIFSRAQKANASSIETPNNSELGEYIRNRIGVASGAFVSKEDLERYGRTDVTFYKIDDETYYMDFSVQITD